MIQWLIATQANTNKTTDHLDQAVVALLLRETTLLLLCKHRLHLWGNDLVDTLIDALSLDPLNGGVNLGAQEVLRLRHTNTDEGVAYSLLDALETLLLDLTCVESDANALLSSTTRSSTTVNVGLDVGHT